MDIHWGFLLLCCMQRQLEGEEVVEDEQRSVNRFTSSMTVTLKSGVWATADSEGRELQIRVLHEAMTW